MKKTLILLACFLVMIAQQGNAQRHKKPVKKSGAKKETDKGAKSGKTDVAQFRFTDGDTYDFKKVTSGPVATHEFSFVNTGNIPLIIQDIKTSCPCLKVEYPRHPIVPRAKGTIKIIYQTDKLGPFNNEVFIHSNATLAEGQKRYTVRVKGTIEAKQ